MDIDSLITSRRTVYPSQFLKGDIPDESILQLLENANMAPTHKMTQPWIFKVYKNLQKSVLADSMVDAIKKNNPTDSRLDFKTKKIYDKCNMSNSIIGIFMKRSTTVSIPEWEEIASVAMAVQNIWLTCAAKEIGCYWSSPKFTKHMDSFFDLSSDERCLGFMYLGKFNHNSLPVKQRTSIKSKIEWLV